MKPISNQTKSFIILSAIAVLGTFLTAVYVGQVKKQIFQNDSPNENFKLQHTAAKAESTPLVDTAGWKTFNDPNFKLTFKYPPDWQSKIVKRNEFTVIVLDPGPKFDNVRIYVTQDGYFAMEGLPTEQMNIAGTTALNVKDMLVGVKSDGDFFTFDLGYSLSLKPKFKTILSTVTFK